MAVSSFALHTLIPDQFEQLSSSSWASQQSSQSDISSHSSPYIYYFRKWDYTTSSSRVSCTLSVQSSTRYVFLNVLPREGSISLARLIRSSMDLYWLRQ